MRVKNFLTTQLRDFVSHDGIGNLKHCGLFDNEDFETAIEFINYTVIPPGGSIGMHKHGEDEELYIILSGKGKMKVNDETGIAKEGDVFLNKPHGNHGLFNDGNEEIGVLVLKANK